jgi:8-oxo-dGTP pyrophosphatase MutT (NUDIX family)
MPPKRKAKDMSSSKDAKAEVPVAPEKKAATCNGVKIVYEYAHIDSKLDSIVQSPKLKSWISNMVEGNQITLQEFHVTDVDFFGPVNPARLGFLKGYGVACNSITGDKIPAIAFIRGGAIAVLSIVNVLETGKKYVLMCKQLRFPCGGAKIEACAGMIDADATVVGVVFAEVKEETGFQIVESELLNLGKITPSAGGCDEEIYLYAWETSITHEEFLEKERNVFGEGAYEKIKLIFYPFEEFDDVLDEIGDVKAECCWRRYQKHLSKQANAKRLPDSSSSLIVECSEASQVADDAEYGK